ncbi:MAG: hypothetical protein AAFX99_03735, partial [Myxococcota bacterium]
KLQHLAVQAVQDHLVGGVFGVEFGGLYDGLKPSAVLSQGSVFSSDHGGFVLTFFQEKIDR